MQAIRFAFGVLLFVAGLSGLLAVALGPRDAVQAHVSQLMARAEEKISGVPTQTPEVAAAVHEAVTPPPEGAPISYVEIPSIRLAAEVVPARLVRIGEAQTWEVPAFKAGHAEGTAGAGAAGNAILLGHVSSVNAGNVFKDLERARPGDVVRVTGEDGATLEYRVSETWRVPREDVSILEDGGLPEVTLITCTGTWLPNAQDYSHRFVVRATIAG